jgi:hypothetical protein
MIRTFANGDEVWERIGELTVRLPAIVPKRVLDDRRSARAGMESFPFGETLADTVCVVL